VRTLQNAFLVHSRDSARRSKRPAHFSKVSGPVPTPLRRRLRWPCTSTCVAARGPIVVMSLAGVMSHPQNKRIPHVTRSFVATASDTIARHLVVPFSLDGGAFVGRVVECLPQAGVVVISSFVQKKGRSSSGVHPSTQNGCGFGPIGALCRYTVCTQVSRFPNSPSRSASFRLRGPIW